MNRTDFVDYYELLEVSSSASQETIERVFRYLAKKFHPDVAETSDMKRFSALVEAYDILRDVKSRAAYDAAYEQNERRKMDLANGSDSANSDTVDRDRLLSVFYAQRRRDMKKPGVGIGTLEQILHCPSEILEFHLWYFREKGWINREESGLLAISAAGVDEVEQRVRRADSPHYSEPQARIPNLQGALA